MIVRLIALLLRLQELVSLAPIRQTHHGMFLQSINEESVQKITIGYEPRKYKTDAVSNKTEYF